MCNLERGFHDNSGGSLSLCSVGQYHSDSKVLYTNICKYKETTFHRSHMFQEQLNNHDWDENLETR